MKLTKSDLMRLSKERLAEIILEMQEKETLTLTTPAPELRLVPVQVDHPFCWEPGGMCTNPQMDCINCPKYKSYVYTGPHIDTYISGDTNSFVTDGKGHPLSAI